MGIRGSSARTARASAVAVLAVVAVSVLGGCAQTSQTSAGGEASPQSSTPTSSVTSAQARDPETAGPNDLKTGKTAQTFAAGSLTLNAAYSTSLATKHWTPSVGKPLAVSLSALDNSTSSTKIYLSRVTMTVTPSDSSGPIGNPLVITDTANINPGYLVNFPYTYEQIFTVPAVDEGVTALSFSFKYELLSTVPDATKDYTKQTAVSTIQVPLA